ncbi:toxin [Longimycelium tulufanense]|uniref:Toxin n=1 Tax=Longimycelium tulufanense TaxID=907463 RepID=A0A8J3CDI9_9PSEU|nr:DUF397 domain-containing protein [Longimycelium tulufanense]GGM52632.1 toxin [Longimycelium tulufanense]
MMILDLPIASWRKSSRSASNGGNCVEVGAWRKSSRSGSNGGACVEVAPAASLTAVRDSKKPTGPVLTFDGRAWSSFQRALKAGRLDL